MQLTPIKKEERTILIAMAVGYVLISLAFVGWGVYLLSHGVYTFELLVYAIGPNIVLVIFAPRIIKLFADISSKEVLEGTGVIEKLDSWLGRDHYIILDVLGKEKIKVQPKDRFKLMALVGKKNQVSDYP